MGEGALSRRSGLVGLLVALLVAVPALLLTACGDDEEGGGPTELSFFIFNEPSGILPTIADKCTKESGGAYTIEFEYLPSDADQQREQLVRRLGAEDSSIDIIGMDVIWTGEFANAGWVEEWTGQDATDGDAGRVPERGRDGALRGQALGRSDLVQHAAALVPDRPRGQAAEDLGRDVHGRRPRSAPRA